MVLVADRVKELTTTTGTGTLTLTGAPTGFQTFSGAFGNGVSVYYVIDAGSAWEIGIGTTGAGTLSRDTVLQSTNGDAKVDLAAGDKTVFCAYVADRAVTTSDAATLTNKTIDDYTNNVGANSTHFRIKANATLAKGDVVKSDGFTPGEQAIQVIKVASSTDVALGIVEQALNTGEFGTAVVIGELFGVNTNGLAVGATLYSNGTGGFTTTKPSSGLFQSIGWVVRANSSTGVIAVNVVNQQYVEASANTANTLVLRDGSGNFSAGTVTAALTGNASTATTLQTARNINNVSFNGSADITVTAAAGTLTGTTLAANVVSSSLTSVGTLTNLTVTNPISGSVTGSSGSTTGNAATATALQTARNINGVSFNGTADITVTAAAGTLTGTTLASGVTASSLTSVGTLTNLTVTNTITGSVSGNAGTATTLANTRTLWGQNFNGSANVTGSLTSVGDITGTAGVTLTATSGTLALAATGANVITASTNGSERMRLDASGNLGLGVTPSATQAQYRSIELFGSYWMGGNGTTPVTYLYTNTYFDGADRYKTSGFAASMYRSLNGTHAWLTAPSGTAGNAITFTQAMTLTANGKLLVGTTSESSGGSIQAVLSNATGGGIQFHNTTGSTGGAINSAASAGLQFYGYTGAVGSETFTERMRIDSSGNVRIGTTADASLGLTNRVHIAAPNSNIGYALALTADSAGRGLALVEQGYVNASSGAGVFISPSGSITAGINGGNAFGNITIPGGNLGLSTTSPSYLLSLGGNSARTIGMERHTTADTAGNNLTVLAGGATSGATDKNGGTLVLSSGVATGTGGSVITFATATGGGTGTTDRNPTERMRINSSGNVGIGTTDPTIPLSLGGNAARIVGMERHTTADTAGNNLTVLAGGATIGATDKNGGSLLLHSGTATGSGSSIIAFATATAGASGTTNRGATEKMRIDGDGNVGIGTITPSALSARLVTAGSGDQNIIFGHSDNITGRTVTLRLTNTNSTFYTYGPYLQATEGTGLDNYSALSFGINTTERMRIDSSGNVGIGTTSPSYPLSFGGNAARTVGMERHTTANTAGNALTILAGGATSGATDKNGGTLALSSGTATGSGSSIITFSTAAAGAAGTADRAPSERMRIDGIGNIGFVVAPSAWGGSTSYKAIEGNYAQSIAFDQNFPNINITANAFFSSAWTYKTTNPAARYMVEGGAGRHIWFTAPSGTAGDAITFTQAMTLNANGNLGIGTTSPTAKLQVNGSIVSGALYLYVDPTGSDSNTGLTSGSPFLTLGKAFNYANTSSNPHVVIIVQNSSAVARVTVGVASVLTDKFVVIRHINGDQTYYLDWNVTATLQSSSINFYWTSEANNENKADILLNATMFTVTTGTSSMQLGGFYGSVITFNTNNLAIATGDYRGQAGILNINVTRSVQFAITAGVTGSTFVTGNIASPTVYFNQMGDNFGSSIDATISTAGVISTYQASNLNFGTVSNTFSLGWGGQSARTIGVDRHTTANTAGNNLTILAGGATSGATDKNGGTLALSSGTATGSGSSVITFSTAAVGTAGTADRAPAERMRIDGANVAIGTTTPYSRLTISSGASNDTRLLLQSDASGGSLGSGYLLGLIGSEAYAYNYANGSLILGTNNVERARIHASGGLSLGNTTDPGAGNLSVTGTILATTAGANALTIGRQGATSPAFNVDASTASSATGLNVKAAAAAGGLAVSVLSSGTNENLTVDAKGSGTVTINGTATGAITLARNTNVTGNLSATGQLDGGYNDTTGSANTAAQALGSNTVSMVLISANTTLTSTVPPAGAHASVIIKTSGNASRTVTFGTGFKSQGTLATGNTADRYWVVNFVSDGTFLYESSRTTTAYA